jgi:two-component system sensor histidine kinase ChvG
MVDGLARACRRMSWLGRSFAAKLSLLLVVFLAVPGILYGQFRAVDAERTGILLRSVQEEGRLIALGLSPRLERFEAKSAAALSEEVERIADGRVNVRVLFRPRTAASPQAFYYVASAPPVSIEHLEQERRELVRTAILSRLGDACEGDLAQVARYTNPAGREEILTSLVPVTVKAGCWVVITSHATASLLGSSIGRPYWMTPEVRLAAAIYVLMASIVISLFVAVWRNMRRFQRAARDIRTGRGEGASFAALNRVPELAEVAGEFDRLVRALKTSESLIRQAAEENAHAFKGPLAVISQCVEPLRASLASGDQRSCRSLELIERSAAKLDVLVSAARRMDEAVADLMDPPRENVDLSELLREVVGSYAEVASARDVRIEPAIAPGAEVVAHPDHLETVAENLLDNALGFSPRGGRIRVRLDMKNGTAELSIEDDGPGVAPDNLGRIFERYHSCRSNRPGEEAGESDANRHPDSAEHFGIGLWIVRRNVAAFGGEVRAENGSAGGLRVVVRLPLAG